MPKGVETFRARAIGKHKSRFDSTFGLRRSLIWRKILAAESDCEHWLDIEIGNRKS